MTTPSIKVQPTPAAVAQAAAERVVAAAHATLAEHETFTLCLAGGSTPKALYTLLAGDEFRDRIPWNRVEIFFGDERTVPADHADSNFAIAKATLLDHVPIPGDNINRMKGELDPEEAATLYGRMLKERFGEDGGFDLLLLGMGDDGHTLSLFPGTAALDETSHRCVANFVKKLESWRITLTSSFANRSENVLAFITGQSKAAALHQVLEGDHKPQQYPMQLIQPASGNLIFLLDTAAVAMEDDD